MSRRQVVARSASGAGLNIPFKKGDVTLGWELVGLIVMLSLVIFGISLLAKFGPFLTGGGKEQAILDNFNALASEAARLADSKEPYAVVEKFPYNLGDSKHTLIGFDAGGKDVTTTGIECLTTRTKPTECGSKACICLFDPTMNPTPSEDISEHLKGLIACKRFDGISTISSLKEDHGTEVLMGAQGSGTRGLNLGGQREKIPLIKDLPPPLQASDHLYIQHRTEQDACQSGVKLGPVSIGTPTERVFARYENQPLSIERVTIDGVAHLLIAPASAQTLDRMNRLKPLLGITIQTVTRRLSSGDFAGVILDTKAWLEHHQPIHEDYGTMLHIQAQGFSRISELDAPRALALLDNLKISVPLPDQANNHAGLLALRIYKNAMESAGQSTAKTAKELHSTIVLEALQLAEKLTGYQPDEIDKTLLPLFQKAAETIQGIHGTGAFLAARNAAMTNAPNAAALLTAFIQTNPDNDHTREARYLLAQLQEKSNLIRESLETYQQIILRHRGTSQKMSDGRTLTASDEIQRICTTKLLESEILDICAQVRPGTACPQPELVLLPDESCAKNLLDERRCKATEEAARAFAKAQQLATSEKKTLHITSAHRTIDMQRALFESRQRTGGDEAARPSCIAPHVTGGALDITFKDTDMGNQIASDMSNPNRRLLEKLMCQAGFTRYVGEYWHYEIGTRRATAHPAVHPGQCAAP